MKDLIDNQILSDLLALGFHGRRVMERHKMKSATIDHDPLWPVSSTPPPTGNLWDAFGTIVHAHSLEVIWENTALEPTPYLGRDAKFASSIKAMSDESEMILPIGAIVAAYVGGVLNKLESTKAKELRSDDDTRK